MKKETQPKYLPKVARAKLHTARNLEEVRERVKGQGFTRNEMKAMVRCLQYFDGLEIYVSKWNWDNYKGWHLHNWNPQDDETVKKALYEAEQFHPYAINRYKNNFEQFCKDWDAEAYDPGMTFTFADEEVEVLEIVQEEVNNIDPEEVQKAIKRNEMAKMEKQQRRRARATKGARYQKHYY